MAQDFKDFQVDAPVLTLEPDFGEPKQELTTTPSVEEEKPAIP